MINDHPTARITRLPRNPNNFRHRDPSRQWVNLTREAVDLVVIERARGERIAYVDAALDLHLSVCAHCGARRAQFPVCPCCGAVLA